MDPLTVVVDIRRSMLRLQNMKFETFSWRKRVSKEELRYLEEI